MPPHSSLKLSPRYGALIRRYTSLQPCNRSSSFAFECDITHYKNRIFLLPNVTSAETSALSSWRSRSRYILINTGQYKQHRAPNVNIIRHFYVHACSLAGADCTTNGIMGRKGGKKGKHRNAGVAQNQGNWPANPSSSGLKKIQQTSKVPSKINLVVIGTGGPGSSPSLLVTTEYSRYLFNCGEGTQRLAAMSKGLRVAAYAKVAGLEHIFITHKSWENTGGLLGMTMTLEGQKNPESKAFTSWDRNKKGGKVPHITVHGPPGVEKIALMAKKFAVSANMNILKSEGEFQDFAFTITPVPLYKDSKATTEGPRSDAEDGKPAPAKRQRRDSSPASTREMACAYICKARPPLPKINVEKCYDAGITIGPMVGKLQRGESVVLENGTVVHPEQVRDVPVTDTRPFLILECPSLEFFPSLLESPQLQPYMQGLSDSSFVVIAHMTPSDVFNSPEYQSWMKKFHSSTDHLVLNRDSSEVDLIRVRDHQARLNVVSDEVFPLLPESQNITTMQEKSTTEEESQTQTDFLKKTGQMVKSCSGLLYVLRGKVVGFQVETDEFNVNELQEKYLETPEVQEKLTALRENVPQTSGTTPEEEDDEEETLTKYPKVTFLGTGSSELNRIRAQSCIVVQLSKHSVMILDCGEDSYGQMYRFFGKAKTSRLLRKLKAVFISHMHGDHHLGLFSLLKERKLAFAEKDIPYAPVLLIAPIQMRRWLRFYQNELEPVTNMFRFVKHQPELKEFDDALVVEKATFEDIKNELNLTEYKSVEVEHCNNAYGVALRHTNGFKLVYSGDTRPCNNLVAAGEDCDLLIHEATHEDSLFANAKASRHSTFSEAMEVGAKMGAKNIILTHFSQRYSHMVPFFDMTLPPNVGIAFDNMRICPSTLKYLPKMIPTLTALFDEELRRLEIKNIKRLRDQGEAVLQMTSENS